MWFLRIRGADIKVVVIVPHGTCCNEQMAETEAGKFPYFWFCPVQFDHYSVSLFEGAKLFFACGGTCFELAEIFHKCDARIHRLRIRKKFDDLLFENLQFRAVNHRGNLTALNIRSTIPLGNLTCDPSIYLIHFTGSCFLPYLRGRAKTVRRCLALILSSPLDPEVSRDGLLTWESARRLTYSSKRCHHSTCTSPPPAAKWIHVESIAAVRRASRYAAN
jgi:hypothetical protein